MSSCFKWIRAISRIGLGLLLAALTCGARANGPAFLPDDFQLYGFLSQGYVKTSANRFYGESDKGSWDLREIGVNLSYRPRPELLISGQLLSRTAGNMYDGELRLDYGLIDYAPLMDLDRTMGVRLGRLKNPLGLYNDTRDVPFTRPSIFLPQSIYFDRVRNLELSLDGGGLYGDFVTDAGEFFFQLNYGLMDVDKNVEAAFLGQDWPGEMKTDDPWVTARLIYEYEGGDCAWRPVAPRVN